MFTDQNLRNSHWSIVYVQCNSNQNPGKFLCFFGRNQWDIPKYIWKYNEHKVVKTTLRKSAQSEIYTAAQDCDYRTGSKGVWYWHQKRQRGQQNRTESLETDPDVNGQVFCKGERHTWWGKESIFDKRCWKKCHMQKINLNLRLTPYTKVNSIQS